MTRSNSSQEDAESQRILSAVSSRLFEPFNQLPAIGQNDSLRCRVGGIGHQLHISNKPSAANLIQQQA